MSPPDFSSSPALPAPLQPGDEIRIKSGTYTDVAETLTASGTALNPVRMSPVAADGTTPAPGTIIVNDDFADVDRTKTGALDADWWSSNSSSGNSVEIDGAGLGMVTGTSGRGIHATFPPQTLAIGETLTATFTFTTPTTIGTDKGGAFKVALADFNNAGLAAD